MTARDMDGASDITRLYFLINPTPNIPQNTCHGFYDRIANALFLYNDGLTAITGPLTPGAAQAIQNSQCAINGAATTVVTTATDLTLNLNLTIKTTAATNAYLSGPSIPRTQAPVGSAPPPGASPLPISRPPSSIARMVSAAPRLRSPLPRAISTATPISSACTSSLTPIPTSRKTPVTASMTAPPTPCFFTTTAPRHSYQVSKTASVPLMLQLSASTLPLTPAT